MTNTRTASTPPSPDVSAHSAGEQEVKFWDSLKIVDFQAANAPAVFAQSLKDTGFAVLTNHIVDEKLIQEVYQEWRDFLTYLDENQEKLCAEEDLEQEFSTTSTDPDCNADESEEDGNEIVDDTTPKEQINQKQAEMFSLEKNGKSKSKSPLPYMRNLKTQDGYFPVKHAESAKGQTVRDIKHYYQCYFPWGRYPKEVSLRAQKLFRQMIQLGRILLQWIDEHMDPEVRARLPGKLTDCLSEEQTMLRVLHYPAYKSKDFAPGAVRAAAHEDINLITVLPAGSARGLQVQSNQSGEWYEVPCVPGSIVINIGDMLQEMTNREYIATTHRVLKMEEGERMSTPCFIHATKDTYLSERYKTAGDFLMERLRELGVA
ncbi:unnamed protein product [Amoebophrya sp. A120]|nr:unnamed protein product [Amoebophrya sp. A120]|eukprot:GSA120T00005570001.1